MSDAQPPTATAVDETETPVVTEEQTSTTTTTDTESKPEAEPLPEPEIGSAAADATTTTATSAADAKPVKQIRVSAADRTKLEKIFEFFDRDRDEHLNATELNNLQIATEGQPFENNAQIMFVCKLLEMNPIKGVNFVGFTR